MIHPFPGKRRSVWQGLFSSVVFALFIYDGAIGQSPYMYKPGHTSSQMRGILTGPLQERDHESQEYTLKTLQDRKAILEDKFFIPLDEKTATLKDLLSMQSWEDASGSFKTEASFQRFLFAKGAVELKRENGQLITVPLARLGNQERERLTAIAEQLGRRTKESENLLVDFTLQLESKRTTDALFAANLRRNAIPDWAWMSSYLSEIIEVVPYDRPVSSISEAFPATAKELSDLELNSTQRLLVKLLACKFIAMERKTYLRLGKAAEGDFYLAEDSSGHPFFFLCDSAFAETLTSLEQNSKVFEQTQQMLPTLEQEQKVSVLGLIQPEHLLPRFLQHEDRNIVLISLLKVDVLTPENSAGNQ